MCVFGGVGGVFRRVAVGGEGYFLSSFLQRSSLRSITQFLSPR